ncbi:hypothetical protein QQ045_027441 [Rhodiola kirilowii]
MVRSEKLKSAAVVIGALGLAWMTLELAFKPFLDQARKAVDKSDPNRDPDDDEEEDKSYEPSISSKIASIDDRASF